MLDPNLNLQAALQHAESTRLTGELALACAEKKAKFYFSGGKLAWGHAAGQAISFQTILVEEYGMKRDLLLEALRHEQQLRGKSLDRILLTAGISDPKLRQLVIQRHTQAAISTAALWQPLTARVFERTGDDYGPPCAASSESSKAISGAKPPSIDELLNVFRSEVPLLTAAGVIDGETGTLISAFTTDQRLDLESAAAHYREILNCSKAGEQSVGWALNRALTEVQLSSTEATSLLWPLGSRGDLLFVIIAAGGNPALARIVQRRVGSALRSHLSC